jgi:hypothetical protein
VNSSNTLGRRHDRRKQAANVESSSIESHALFAARAAGHGTFSDRPRLSAKLLALYDAVVE